VCSSQLEKRALENNQIVMKQQKKGHRHIHAQKSEFIFKMNSVCILFNSSVTVHTTSTLSVN